MSRPLNIAHEVRDFIISNFLYGRSRPFTDQDSLMGEGIVDSTGVLELVAFLQQIYQITVEDEELRLENLDSIDNITAYLARKMSVAVETDIPELQETTAGGRI
jgi:acyl carrier protein